MGAPRSSSGAATMVSSRCCVMCTVNSVVSYAPMTDWVASNSIPRPAIQYQVRRRGTGFDGCARFTDRTRTR